jgi:basic amino acid/polyamine antiporter, APA family
VPVALGSGVKSFESQAKHLNEKLTNNSTHGLARRLGLFDATMIVMGGIIGSGIFINPSVVAKQVHTPALILGAWAVGGFIALAGAFVYAELAAVRSDVGGQYAYIREAFHPSVAFIYGWTLLLVTQTGGMAAVAITFAKYFLEITRLPASDVNAAIVATLALGLLTVINCLGVRAGSTVQNALMVLKIAAIAALVACGLLFVDAPAASAVSSEAQQTPDTGLLIAFGAALIPVMFAYGGWQTASFISGELREPQRNLPRGLLFGVLGVIVVYLAVNFVCIQVLGVYGLANTETPASAVMRLALGDKGAQFIAVGIAISTLGFLSQGMLTAPRVYFAMAEDGVFFKGVAKLSNRRVPVVAIALQGLVAIIIALSGKYGQILNYVVSVDFIFFGLTAICVFVFRARRSADAAKPDYQIPGHPLTTIFFIAACWIVVASTIYSYPKNSVIGFAIMLAGLPVYFLWQRPKP